MSARRAVGAMPVLQHDDEGRLLRQHVEQRGQRVDERRLQMLALPQVPGKRVRLARHRQQVEVQRYERFQRLVDRVELRRERS